MKAPVVIVVITLAVGILVVGSFLIATGAHGENAVRLACANLPARTDVTAIAGARNRSDTIQSRRRQSTNC
jgi:hypothetical protein